VRAAGALKFATQKTFLIWKITKGKKKVAKKKK